MRYVALQQVVRQLTTSGRLVAGLLAFILLSVMAIADVPIASSSFVGAEDPLSENGAWVALTSLAPNGTRFQKNNGAYPDRLEEHAGARTTAAVPADQYSEIVVGHAGSTGSNLGPIVRVQTTGSSIDSHYLWWTSPSGGVRSLYRIDANGTSYTANALTAASNVVDGDRLRLVARGQVIYGVKNGVRDFVYNTATNATKYSTGATGMLAYAQGAITNAMIASWSTGSAPVSSGSWTSSNFAGTENPLDEGDRWYPLPGYAGFSKAGNVAIGLSSGHNAEGVWSISPPPTQYSEVTLSGVASGGGGPIVRIDRNNPGQTGWLLFLFAATPSSSGIYKMTPDGGFAAVRPFTPTIVSGDKWRLTATGNTLEVFRNGVSQFTYTTDGSYPTGDVGIEAYTTAFTFSGWEGGDTAGGAPPDTQPPTAPSNLTATAASSSQINLAWGASTDNVGVTSYNVERCQGAACSTFVQIATVPGTTYNDAALTANTSYSYRVRAADAAGNLSLYSNVASATTAATAPSAPTITSFTPTTGPAGTGVTISGTNFTGATSVAFNGASAAFTVNSATAIQATVPNGATSGPLSVTTPGGTATSTSTFTVAASAPTITSFTPTTGPAGTGVTISGTNFTGATAVAFNGASAAFTVSSATAIQATVPSGATTGPLSVTTPGGTATSTSTFTVAAGGSTLASSFVGAENPLSENGAWVAVTAYSPFGTVFQKNNGAFADRLSGLNHAGARTTAIVPVDHYSEIVVGHVANTNNNVGAIARVQTSGPSVDSMYLWWASVAGGGNFLYRMDGHVPDQSRGTSYTATALTPTSPVVDGDRLRLIARGQVLYGIKNGVRDFIYNTATNPTKYSTGATGIFSYSDGAITNAVIASWASGPAPVSSGTWASTSFAGTENPLDEGDRWYPLPGYLGFKKSGGAAIGLGSGHNVSGVWSIAPPAKQYSEVTLGTVGSGGGGPVVRIDRNNPGQTGWLLFLFPSSPASSGIYKLTPDGNFVGTQLFTPTIVAGDKWRLAADGNILEVFRNGVSQFTYTTDGSYPAGDVGIEAFTSAFTFTGWEGGDPAGAAPQVPTITSFTPTSGPVGASVTISGTNFTGATAVAFNGTAATFVVTSNTTIQATVPAGATTGPIGVTTPGGTATSASAFTLTAGPAITSFTPTSGPVGTSVTINGTNFTGATTVSFNGVAAAFTVTSATAIQATVPAGATTGPLGVTTPGGTATSASSFTVLSPPTITSFTPTSGLVGAGVTISGTNFTGATTVTFHGVTAAFTVTSATAIQATVPAGATTGPLGVTTPGGTATSASSFTVLSPPTIASFTPTSGLVGASVTISGTNLTGATAVAFNGTAATFTVASATSIQATVPAGATTGPISVTTAGGTATSASSFIVLSPPTIASFTPTSGLVGASVTISGTNFTGVTAVGFNGTSATFTVTSATSIQTAVPADATTGPISVTTSGGTATSASSFTVLSPPTITSFTPTSGLMGASVRISGTNFTGATAVTFNGVTAAFTVTSAMAIQATVPAGATTGPLGVTTPGGTATSASSFTVLSPPTITSFTPTSGLAGTTVTISGANFTGATAVAFNGIAATFTVASATAIQTTVPAAATTGPLTVTTPGGTATSSSAFIVKYTLTVSKTGLLGGTVTSSPAGIDCGGTCSAAFNSSTVVTLTATPAFLSLFNGWTGCDTTSGTTCTVTMSRARQVTAGFLP